MICFMSSLVLQVKQFSDWTLFNLNLKAFVRAHPTLRRRIAIAVRLDFVLILTGLMGLIEEISAQCLPCWEAHLSCVASWASLSILRLISENSVAKDLSVRSIF